MFDSYFGGIPEGPVPPRIVGSYVVDPKMRYASNVELWPLSVLEPNVYLRFSDQNNGTVTMDLAEATEQMTDTVFVMGHHKDFTVYFIENKVYDIPFETQSFHVRVKRGVIMTGTVGLLGLSNFKIASVIMEAEDDLGPIYGFNGNYWDAGQEYYVPVQRKILPNTPEDAFGNHTSPYVNPWDSSIYAAQYLCREQALAQCQGFKETYGEDIFNRLINLYTKLIRTDTILPYDWAYIGNFFHDCTKIPGWVGFLRNPDGYVLDNTYYGSNGYSVETCVWMPVEEQDHYRALDRGNNTDTLQRFPIQKNGRNVLEPGTYASDGVTSMSLLFRIPVRRRIC